MMAIRVGNWDPLCVGHALNQSEDLLYLCFFLEHKFLEGRLFPSLCS